MTAEVCWQYLVKQQKRAGHNRRTIVCKSADALIQPISFAEAQAFVVQYEWLGNMGAAKYCFGLRLGSELAAVTCYTTPSSPIAYRTLFGSELSRRVFQLCRGASSPWAPKWAPSMLISRSLRLMAREHRAVAVVAYADPEAGEVGTVYQAANALYLGLTDSRGPGKYIIGGREYHARAVQKLFGSAAHEYLIGVDPNYRRIQRTKKHRYLFLIGTRSIRRELLLTLSGRVKSYPKRAAGVAVLEVA
jgi:hypothetical protein